MIEKSFPFAKKNTFRNCWQSLHIDARLPAYTGVCHSTLRLWVGAFSTLASSVHWPSTSSNHAFSLACPITRKNCVLQTKANQPTPITDNWELSVLTRAGTITPSLSDEGPISLSQVAQVVAGHVRSFSSQVAIAIILVAILKALGDPIAGVIYNNPAYIGTARTGCLTPDRGWVKRM